MQENVSTITDGMNCDINEKCTRWSTKSSKDVFIGAFSDYFVVLYCTDKGEVCNLKETNILKLILTNNSVGEAVFGAPLCCSSRLALTILVFFGLVNLYALRVNMSVAIVCMTRQPSNGESCQNDNTSTKIKIEHCQQNDTTDGNFDWDKKTQGLVLSSFFWGYILTQVAGGWLSGRYGGKKVFGWCMLVCSVSTLLMPVAAQFNVFLLIALRIVAGLTQGVVWPSTSVLFAQWVPPLERSRLCSLGFAGAHIGVVITFPLSSVLCSSEFAGGWPSIFYVFGTCGVVWFVVWICTVYDTPLQHPRISQQEKIYIVNSLRRDIVLRKKSKTTPWRKIFSSLPVWACIVSLVCTEWGSSVFHTNITSYMDDVLDFKINKAGFLSALPYIGVWATANVSGHLADFLISRKYVSTTNTRKIFNSITTFLPALFVILTGYMENPNAAVTMLTIGVAMSGCQFGSGSLVNPLDIAPMYAGIIFGIANSMGTLAGILAPLSVGIITVDRTREQWQYIFIITACIYIFGGIFYIIFGSGTIQSWALGKEDTPDIVIDTIPSENGNTTDSKAI